MAKFSQISITHYRKIIQNNKLPPITRYSIQLFPNLIEGGGANMTRDYSYSKYRILYHLPKLINLWFIMVSNCQKSILPTFLARYYKINLNIDFMVLSGR